MEEGALVLEGGAFRGVSTSGVLDAMIDDNFYLSYVIGVSAGALTGTGYVARQRGFSKSVNLEYRNDKNYVGLKAIYKEKSIIGFDYLFNEISVNKVPFDFDAFYESNIRFIATTSCIETGKAEYFEKDKCPEILRAVRASSSIPVITPNVKIGDKHYHDGGICDPVPFLKAMDDGYKKIVVVLTRPLTYEGHTKRIIIDALKKIYHKNKEFYKAIINMDKKYNDERIMLKELVDSGKVFVIAPKTDVYISNLEKDVSKLEAFYQDGYNAYYEAKDALIKYFAQDAQEI